MLWNIDLRARFLHRILLSHVQTCEQLHKPQGAATVRFPIPPRCTATFPRQMDRADARVQCRILRILLMIPVYSVTTMFSYVWYWHAVYWEVARDCYEAFAIAAFFALLCQFIAPQLGSQKEYFATMPVKPWPWPANWFNKCVRGKLRAPRSGLTWFNVSSRYWL